MSQKNAQPVRRASGALLLIIPSLLIVACSGGAEGPAGPAGAAGSAGEAGPAAESCAVSRDAQGVTTITCGDGSSVQIPAPESGTSSPCSVVRDEAAGQATITCPDGTMATLSDGEAGGAGMAASCRVEERAQGAVFVVCAGSPEVEIKPADPQLLPDAPTLSLLAGVTSVGTSDGIGRETRMDGALDGVFDATGDFLYFVDTFNMTIRRFGLRTQRVVTLAGSAGRKGASDGTGDEVTFDGPRGIAMHPDGDRLFIADGFNCTVRQLELSTRQVTTLVGSPGVCGAVDGDFDTARLRFSIGMVMDPAGQYLYLSERGNNIIRRLDLANRVTETIVGILPAASATNGSASSGYVDGIGDAARFNGPGGIDLSADGETLYVNDTFNNVLRAVSLVDKTASGGPAAFETRTLAGMAGERGNVDGVGDAARFATSQGLARSGDKLYVAGFHGTIRSFDLNTSEVTTVAGASGVSGSTDGPARDARFGVAFGILASPDDRNLYYMDRGNNNIRRFDRIAEQVDTVMGASEPVGWRDGAPGESRMNDPAGIWASADGQRVYVADRGNHVLRRYDRQTRQLVTLVGLPGRAGFADGEADEARLNNPRAVWVDADERFAYVADSGNDAVRVVNLTTGQVTTLMGRPLSDGESAVDGLLEGALSDVPVAVLGATNDAEELTLYIGEEGSNTVRMIRLVTGSVSTLAGGGAVSAQDPDAIDGVGAEAVFSNPTGLALSADGLTLYVADRGHHVIRSIELSTASVSTFAGDINVSDAFDGVGADATFDGPTQLSRSEDGTALYVSDLSNHAIRRVSLSDARVTTVVGTLGISGGSGQLQRPLESARLYFAAGVAATPDGLFLTADEALMFATPQAP